MSRATGQIRVIVFGAHPDDCEIVAGGTALHFLAAGHAVKFVSVTSGDSGHHREGGGILANRRREEAAEAGRRLGLEYVTLDFHDGELLPTLEPRNQVIRLIRCFDADIVIGPRPNDYHPDHRYTGILMQDAAYLVVVPNVTPDTPPLRKNPLFLYAQDGFVRPCPFRPDIAVGLSEEVRGRKIHALDAHVSQFYEWLPWVDDRLSEVPQGAAERLAWLAGEARKFETLNADVRRSLEKWYGAERAAGFPYAEAFEICEYGRQPDDAEVRRLFPMLGSA